MYFEVALYIGFLKLLWAPLPLNVKKRNDDIHISYFMTKIIH